MRLGAALAAVALLATSGTAAALQLAARDAASGAAVAARVMLQPRAGATGPATEREVAVVGRAQALDLAPGRWRLHAEAAGYRALDTDIDAATPALTLLLEPADANAAFARGLPVQAVAPDELWLQGYVRDAADGAPLAGARVSAPGGVVYSAADGWFALRLDAAAPAPDALPEEFALEVQAEGRLPWRRSRLLRVPGVQRLVVALGGDTPPTAALELGVRDRRGGPVGASAPLATPALPDAVAAVAPLLAPPASIRVGYADASCTTSCCTGACTTTCVMPLETYVARGLDNEWIPSWHAQSLRAGSIAYRSYGAWRVANPIRAAYDICSSACCQVNDNVASSVAVSSAVARTPGLLLTLPGSGAAFAAEYSAENNGWDDPNDGLACSASLPLCGDGRVGDASNGWPCLADAVAAGHGCFGHGRGMSQWGTQRWASSAGAPLWRWIADHYYNDNGNSSGAGSGNRRAVLSSPLSLAALTATPRAPAPGETLRLGATAHNAAGAEHAHILVGASLYRSGVGYLDDAAHDVPVTLAAAADTAVARTFLVPAAAAAGRYDVLLSLYLDVDENGAIGTTDLALALATLPQAVEIVTDRLFADGFGAP